MELAGAVADEQHVKAKRLGQSYRYDYGLACLNTPLPTFTIFEGAELTNLRSWFQRESGNGLAYFISKLACSKNEIACQS